jgi:hypothetical protein
MPNRETRLTVQRENPHLFYEIVEDQYRAWCIGMGEKPSIALARSRAEHIVDSANCLGVDLTEFPYDFHNCRHGYLYTHTDIVPDGMVLDTVYIDHNVTGTVSYDRYVILPHKQPGHIEWLEVAYGEADNSDFPLRLGYTKVHQETSKTMWQRISDQKYKIRTYHFKMEVRTYEHDHNA